MSYTLESARKVKKFQPGEVWYIEPYRPDRDRSYFVVDSLPYRHETTGRTIWLSLLPIAGELNEPQREYELNVRVNTKDIEQTALVYDATEGGHKRKCVECNRVAIHGPDDYKCLDCRPPSVNWTSPTLELREKIARLERSR